MNMGTPTYRSTPGGIAFDAFYPDEFGAVNDATNTLLQVNDRLGFHKSRHTNVFVVGGTIKEHSSYASISFPNQANPNLNTRLKVKQHGTPASGDLQHATFYFSNTVINYWFQLVSSGGKWETPINLTVLFAVGTELNRHGIRSFFEGQTNMQGIVVISGIEAPRDNPVQYGVSPSTALLTAELKKMFNMDVVFNVKVLAAFSTGFCGLNICLMNELLDLSGVERLVMFDCLYLFGADCNTLSAINLLKSKADKSKFKLVCYKTTQAGNSFADTTKTELHPSLLTLFNSKKGLIENMYYNVLYTYLITHRGLTAAFEDSVIAFPNAAFEKAFNDLKAVMPRRGTLISNLNTFKMVYGASVSLAGKRVFEDWAKENLSLLRSFGKFLGSKKDGTSIRGLLWQNQLPGWSGGPSDGEENHDLLIPEFGWEYLPY